MANCLLIGEIHFTAVPSEEELIELSFFITQKAIDNKIGVNLYGNLTDRGEIHYPMKNYRKEGYIPYEILDNPMTTDCWDMFKNICDENDHSISNVENSGLIKVQHFYEEVLTHEMISYMTIYIEDEHGGPKIIYDYEIKPSEFCRMLEKVPNDINRLEMPAARFKIVK